MRALFVLSEYLNVPCIYILCIYVYNVLFFILNNSIPSICLIACTRGAQLVFGFVFSPFPVATMFSVWFSVVVSLLFSSHHLASDTCFCRFRLSVCFLCVYECCALGVCHVFVIVFLFCLRL